MGKRYTIDDTRGRSWSVHRAHKIQGKFLSKLILCYSYMQKSSQPRFITYNICVNVTAKQKGQYIYMRSSLKLTTHRGEVIN